MCRCLPVHDPHMDASRPNKGAHRPEEQNTPQQVTARTLLANPVREFTSPRSLGTLAMLATQPLSPPCYLKQVRPWRSQALLNCATLTSLPPPLSETSRHHPRSAHWSCSRRSHYHRRATCSRQPRIAASTFKPYSRYLVAVFPLSHRLIDLASRALPSLPRST